MSIKKSSDSIGSRSRDLPVCSAVKLERVLGEMCLGRCLGVNAAWRQAVCRKLLSEEVRDL
jgi:hypothetical protein